jgi:hypothetical protein
MVPAHLGPPVPIMRNIRLLPAQKYHNSSDFIVLKG